MSVQQFLVEHGWKVVGVFAGVAASILGGFLAWYNSRRQWLKRQAYDRFSLSLSTFELVGDAYHLWLYAGIETSLAALLAGNRYAMRLLKRAAVQTTEEDPFIQHLSEEDLKIILNEVANCLECRTFHGALAADAGLSHQDVPYVIGLTCEKRRDIRLRKIRAMMIREDTLMAVPDIEIMAASARPGASTLVLLSGHGLVLEKPHHKVRFGTLQCMKRHYIRQCQGGPKMLLRVEITLSPVSPPARAPGERLAPDHSRATPLERLIAAEPERTT